MRVGKIIAAAGIIFAGTFIGKTIRDIELEVKSNAENIDLHNTAIINNTKSISNMESTIKSMLEINEGLIRDSIEHEKRLNDIQYGYMTTAEEVDRNKLVKDAIDESYMNSHLPKGLEE